MQHNEKHALRSVNINMVWRSVIINNFTLDKMKCLFF